MVVWMQDGLATDSRFDRRRNSFNGTGYSEKVT
jgi:hypothetical protein